MKLYEEPHFVYWGTFPHYTHTVERVFDTWGIQYNHKGRFFCAEDGGEQEVFEGPCVFLTRPGYRFRYGTFPGEEREHYFVTFADENIEKYRGSGVFDLKKPVPVLQKDLFRNTFRELILALNHGRKQFAVNLLDHLFLLMDDAKGNTAQNSNIPYGHEFQKLGHEIELNPVLEWDFEKEAKRIGVSYPHFRRLFRKIFQRAPHQYLLNCRFQLCVNLLRESDFSVSEIASQCGFDDMSLFTRQFKARYGSPPLKYRKRYFPLP